MPLCVTKDDHLKEGKNMPEAMLLLFASAKFIPIFDFFFLGLENFLDAFGIRRSQRKESAGGRIALSALVICVACVFKACSRRTGIMMQFSSILRCATIEEDE